MHFLVVIAGYLCYCVIAVKGKPPINSSSCRPVPFLSLVFFFLDHGSTLMSSSSASGSDSSVYRYNYVTEPEDELKCLICLDVAKDPLQHEECGKLFCKECLGKYGKKKPCPNCKTKDSKYYKDKKSEHTSCRSDCIGVCVCVQVKGILWRYGLDAMTPARSASGRELLIRWRNM